MGFDLEELLTLLKLALETNDITYVQDAIDLINETEDES